MKKEGLGLRSREGLALRRELTKGFTLVELLIVIAVIGILATVLIIAVNPNKQLQKSRDTARKSALKTIQAALEQYYADTGSYPTTVLCRSDQTTTCWRLTGASALFGTNAANYLRAMPSDPSQTGSNCTSTNNRGYAYQATGSGTGYILSTRLENLTDSQIVSSGLGSCSAHNYILINQQ